MRVFSFTRFAPLSHKYSWSKKLHHQIAPPLMSRWCFQTSEKSHTSWISSTNPTTSILIVMSQWVANIVSFASLVKTNHACFPRHHSGGVGGQKQGFSSLSLQSFCRNNTPPSPSWLPCYLRLKARRLWQYGRGLPQQLKRLESYCVVWFHLVRDNLLWLGANNLTLILFVLELKKLHLRSSGWYTVCH